MGPFSLLSPQSQPEERLHKLALQGARAHQPLRVLGSRLGAPPGSRGARPSSGAKTFRGRPLAGLGAGLCARGPGLQDAPIRLVAALFAPEISAIRHLVSPLG